MPDLATFQQLYDEFKAEVLAAPADRLNDFSPGSFLDAFAAVAATASQGIQRWMLRQVMRAFVSDAMGGDLDYVVVDRYGSEISRRPDESDTDYRLRVDAWLDALGRGTPLALRIYAESLEAVLSAAVTENVQTGQTTVTAVFDDTQATDDAVRDAFIAGLDGWRAAGDAVNLTLTPVV